MCRDLTCGKVVVFIRGFRGLSGSEEGWADKCFCRGHCRGNTEGVRIGQRGPEQQGGCRGEWELIAERMWEIGVAGCVVVGCGSCFIYLRRQSTDIKDRIQASDHSRENIQNLSPD